MTSRPSQASGAFETPRLAVAWQGRRENFRESLRAALTGPRASREFDPARSFFRLRIAPGRAPGRGIAASVLWHAGMLAALIPLSQMAMPKPRIALPQIEITWYGPTTNVAPVPTPKPKKSKPKERARVQPRPKRRILVRAYNPKTTVIFHPPRPTNLRQALIEPEAPPEAPKFLPATPNIISWFESAPARPEIAMNPAEVRALRRRLAAARMRAPDIVDATPAAGPLDIAPGAADEVKSPLEIAASALVAERAAAPRSAAAPEMPNAAPTATALPAEANAGPQPPLPPVPNAVRAARSSRSTASEEAPNLTVDARRIVALSLSPGAAPPPPGNASAPISIGPHVARKTVSESAPELSADAATGAGAPNPASANAARGPTGLLILHDSGGPKPVAPPKPRVGALPKIAAISPVSPRRELPRRRPAAKPKIVRNSLARRLLGPWRIHTLLMNMPNLTSSSGSWILNFAEPLPLRLKHNRHIVAPLPIHSVDPDYPPEQIQEGEQGTVVLLAVINVNGTVSGIRVVKSLDHVLDHSAAVALSHWKFAPALLDNRAIPLRVLVSVPFHFVPARQ